MSKQDTAAAEQRESIRKEYEAEALKRDQAIDAVVSSVPEQHRLKAVELVSKARTHGEGAVEWLQNQVISLLGTAVADAAEAAETPAESPADAASIERAKQAAAKVDTGAAIVPISRAPAFLSGDERFSIAKAVGDHKDGRAQTGREREITDELAKSHDAKVSGEGVKRERTVGVQLPKQTVSLEALRHRANSNPEVRRMLQEAVRTSPLAIKRVQDGTATAGLLNDTLMPNLFIEALRPEARIMDWGTQLLTGLRENIDIPEQTSVTSGSWLNIHGQVDPTATSANFRDVPLVMKTFAALVQFTRGSLKQSRPAVDQLVAADLMRTIGIAIQDAALTGTGANNQPTGITNESSVIGYDVAAARVGGTSPNQVLNIVREDVLAMLGMVADENASMEGARWVMRPSRFFALKGTAIDQGSGLFLVDREGMLEGYPVERYSQLSNAVIIYGNFSDLALGFFGEQMEYRTDIHVAGGGRHDRVYCDMDVALRHKKAFVVATPA